MNTTALLEDVSGVINREIIHQLQAQGHLFLDDIITSLNAGTKVQDFKKKKQLRQTAVAYLLKMEEGTPPSEISFGPHSRALTEFYIKLGFDMQTAQKKATFLTYTHLREGSPSSWGLVHSSTGLRKHFIREAFANTEPIVERKMSDGMDAVFLEEFNKQKSEKV